MFDDRLATVLRMRAGSEAALRTQFRQLLDLLGTRDTALSGQALARIARSAIALPPSEIERLLVRPALKNSDRQLATISGFVRLREIQQATPQETQSAILREPGQRLRNPEFVAFLAEGEPKASAAAVATARLSEDQWLDLIPRLPVTARGFLRHRRDLPESVKQLLAQLGVGDLVLPSFAGAGDLPAIEILGNAAAVPSSPSANLPQSIMPEDGIRALRRRIEAFREGRQQGQPMPRNHVPDGAPRREYDVETVIDVFTDSSGVIVRCDGLAAPMLAGLGLTSPSGSSLVEFSDDVAQQLRRHLPIRQARLTIDAAPEISGDWRMDATPLFAQMTGAFSGYAARLYRPNLADPEDVPDSPADAMRQVLHELRTPVNAIQGFAEIIQQQIFGSVPHEYRAHAASIAVDAAKLLAGFDEVDRLFKLESRAMELESGSSDFRLALSDTAQRLDSALRARDAGFALSVSGTEFHVGLDRGEVMAMCWRLLATAAGALGLGEKLQLGLSSDGTTIQLALDIPESLRLSGAESSREGKRRRAISAGMFGPGFAFRLAEAEAVAAGGTLTCEGDRATLRLPVLTLQTARNSSESGIAGA
ncbi:MAG: histidine kinase dimerization/phospho-acceptor domain-containing protein [Alteraurantiacibacter sp.]